MTDQQIGKDTNKQMNRQTDGQAGMQAVVVTDGYCWSLLLR